MSPFTALAERLASLLPFGLDLLLRATLVLLIAQLLLVAMKRHSAASRHFVATLGLAAVVVLPALMLALPDTRLEVLPVANAAAAAVASPDQGTWKSGSDAGIESTAGFTEVARTIASTGIADERALGAASAILWVGDNWQLLALSGLTLIPAFFLFRILLGMLAILSVARHAEPVNDPWITRELAQATRRLSVRRPIRLLISDRINVPLVWGFARPVLILPAGALGWSRERFRVVILHEVAHVRRFDVVSLVTGRIATALYWFHPLSWTLERAGRRECERACDDLVLRSGTRASDYADHLLGIAAGEDLAESYASVTLAMARPSELEGRLVSILRADEERAPVSRRTATIAAAAAFTLLVPIATVRLAAKPPAPASMPDNTAAAAKVQDPLVVQAVDEAGVDPEFVLAQMRLTEYEKEMQESSETSLVKDRRKKTYDSDGEMWFDQAYELHHSDRFDEAIAAFRKSIEHGYRVGTSMYNIACGYAMKGDAANAVRWLDDAFDNGFTKVELVEKDSDLDPIRSDPQFRGLLRDLRAEHGTSGRPDRVTVANQRFEELRASRSQDADAWADAGLDLLRLREMDDAIFALEEAIRLAPEYSSTARYNLACAFALKGDRTRALDALASAILGGFDGSEKMANDPDLQSIRGERRFTELRAMNDDLSLWGGLKQKKDDDWSKRNQDAAFRQELPRFESVVAKYPDAGRAWFNLGFAALRGGSLDRSRTAFQRSLDLGFKPATSMYNLACVEAIAGNREPAFKWLYASEKAGGQLGNLRHDDDLDNLRDDPRFEELLERHDERKYEEKLRKIEEKAKQKMKDAGWL